MGVRAAKDLIITDPDHRMSIQALVNSDVQLGTTMAYTLYIGNKNYSSWSLRPWVLMRQLGIEFNEILQPFDDGVLGSSFDRFRAFSPTGLVPCLHHDDITVWESLAIVEYLYEHHPQVWPEDKEARAWARSAASEMHAGFSHLRNECPMTVGMRINLHNRSDGLNKDLQRMSELWDEGLSKFKGPFLAGDSFTAVDAFFCPVAYRVQTYGLDQLDVVRSYSTHLLELSAMQDWTRAALSEPWREPAHEEEIAALGRIEKDLRD